MIIYRKLVKRCYFVHAANHNQHPLHGRGKNKWQRVDIDRLLHQLILDKYLIEVMTTMRQDIVVAYVKIGPKADELTSGTKKVGGATGKNL